MDKVSDVAVEMMTFMKLAVAEQSKYLLSNPPMHYYLADKLCNDINRLVISVFRGGGKSILTEFFTLFIAYKVGRLSEEDRKPIELMMWFGANEEMASQFIENLKLHWDKSEFLQSIMRFENHLKLSTEIVVGEYRLRIIGKGITSQFRGKRTGMSRPDIIIVDDVLKTDMITSDKENQNIKDTFTKDILPMGSKYTKIIFIGTPVSPNDLLNELLQNSSWVSHKYPLCKKFPCSKEEFEGNWEDNFDFTRVREMYNSAKQSSTGLSGFYQEFMLETVDLSTLLVQPDQIRRRDITYVRKNLENYNIYITTDFAMSESTSSDFSAIGVFAVNNNGDWILIDGQSKQQFMDKNTDDLFRYIRRYTDSKGRVPKVGVEANGPQKGLISMIEVQQDQRNIYFDWAEDKDKNLISMNKGRFVLEGGIVTKKGKTERFITTVLPMFTAKKVIIGIPKPHETGFSFLVDTMLDALSNITMKSGVKGLKKGKDVIDLLNQLGQIDITVPNVTEESSSSMTPQFDPFNNLTTSDTGMYQNSTLF